jgi:7-cyano-7-deazaguanine synthase
MAAGPAHLETPMVEDHFREGQATAVLCSAGLDSAVLVADLSRTARVTPVYVSVGLAWEPAERRALARLLTRPPFDGRVDPPVSLTVDMRDVYPSTHWAVRGAPPAFDTPDEDVYLVGRNLVLLAKAAVFCCQRRIPRIALGPLAGNPFPDATPAFFSAMARAASLGLDHAIEIATPYSALHKVDVVRRGLELGVPLDLTLSCMNPQEDLHCGLCSKCRERHDAFIDAGLDDSTRYAGPLPR